MVLQILESGLVLSFSAYCASLVGLVFSLYGVSHYSSSRGEQQVNKDESSPKSLVDPKPVSALISL